MIAIRAVWFNGYPYEYAQSEFENKRILFTSEILVLVIVILVDGTSWPVEAAVTFGFV